MKKLLFSLGAVILLAVILFTAYDYQHRANAADQIRRTALDGTIQPSIEVMHSYNSLLLQRVDFRIENLVLEGKISRFDAENIKINIKYGAMFTLDSINQYIDTYVK